MRDQQFRCVFCKYFEVTEKSLWGSCHADPPSFSCETGMVDNFTRVLVNDWCGQFKRYQHPEEKELAGILYANSLRITRYRVFGSKKCAEEVSLNQEWSELMLWL